MMELSLLNQRAFPYIYISCEHLKRVVTQTCLEISDAFSLVNHLHLYERANECIPLLTQATSF